MSIKTWSTSFGALTSFPFHVVIMYTVWRRNISETCYSNTAVFILILLHLFYFYFKIIASRMDPQQLQKTQLQKRIENLAEKQMRSSLHARFLQNCIESECVPEGMLLKKKIYGGKDFSDLQKSVDNLLKRVSLEICDIVKSAYQQKVRHLSWNWISQGHSKR